MKPVEPGIKDELYLALLLLKADPVLLGAIANWRSGADDPEACLDIRNWNEAKLLEIKEWLATLDGADQQDAQHRIEEYEEIRQR